MGCNCGAKAATTNTAAQTYKVLNITQPEDCTVTKDMLEKYLAIVKCLRTNNLGLQFGLSSFNLNQLQGIIQSALNYPDNYCYYSAQLESFTQDLLPKIISNAAECVS